MIERERAMSERCNPRDPLPQESASGANTTLLEM